MQHCVIQNLRTRNQKLLNLFFFSWDYVTLA